MKTSKLCSIWLVMLVVSINIPALLHAQTPNLPDDHLRQHSAAERLVLATYKLAHPSSTAAAVAIARVGSDQSKQVYLITADHVLRRMSDSHCMLVSRHLNKHGSYERQEHKIAIRRGEQEIWKRHPREDLALLPINEDLHLNALPVACLATDKQFAEIHVGDAVRLSVFPERNEANASGFPLLRGGSIASFPVLPTKGSPIFRVDTNTWTGDSGGAVMAHSSPKSSADQPFIIGIVRSMINVSDTVNESRFVQRRTDYPLGISEVIASVAVHELLQQF